MNRSFRYKTSIFLVVVFAALGITSCSGDKPQAFSGACAEIMPELNYWKEKAIATQALFELRLPNDNSSTEFRTRLEVSTSVFQNAESVTKDTKELEALGNVITINQLLMRYWDNPQRFDLAKLKNLFLNLDIFINDPIFESCK
jgi:hypothetical protein